MKSWSCPASTWSLQFPQAHDRLAVVVVGDKGWNQLCSCHGKVGCYSRVKEHPHHTCPQPPLSDQPNPPWFLQTWSPPLHLDLLPSIQGVLWHPSPALLASWPPGLPPSVGWETFPRNCLREGACFYPLGFGAPLWPSLSSPDSCGFSPEKRHSQALTPLPASALHPCCLSCGAVIRAPCTGS